MSHRRWELVGSWARIGQFGLAGAILSGSALVGLVAPGVATATGVAPNTTATGVAPNTTATGVAPNATSHRSAAVPGSYVAWVVNSTTNAVVPIDVGPDTVGTPIPVGQGPDAIAITPNGAAAYVANGTDHTVSPVSLTTRRAGAAIPVGAAPLAIAIAPNGTKVYVVGQDGLVTPIDVATNRADPPIIVSSPGVTGGDDLEGIAITSNGSTAYVTDDSTNQVVQIALATGVIGARIGVGNAAKGIAITPDGTKAYVTNQSDGTVNPVDLITKTASPAIKVGLQPDAVAITPNGSTAYVVNGGTFVQGTTSTVTPITISSNVAGSGIGVGFGPSAVAITPDGATAFVANDDGIGHTLTPIAIPANTSENAIQIGQSPRAIAITPDQAPIAAFAVAPKAPGSPTTFDGTASSAAIGTITSYAWSFGDGTSATTVTPTVSHVYAAAGSFTVTLRVTDSAGTSTSQVFTGQTVYQNGGPSAVVRHTVTLRAVTAGAFLASTPDGKGYWITNPAGAVARSGDALFYRDVPTEHIHLNQPIVGIAATPDGKGYWLVASDGGIFTFGDAGFHGSASNIRLNQPIVAMT